MSDHPRRFGGIAHLPLPDVDAALEELAYAPNTLQLDEVVTLASIGKQYLGDSAFDAVFAKFNPRKAVIFGHPTVPVTRQDLDLAMPAAMPDERVRHGRRCPCMCARRPSAPGRHLTSMPSRKQPCTVATVVNDNAS